MQKESAINNIDLENTSTACLLLKMYEKLKKKCKKPLRERLHKPSICLKIDQVLNIEIKF